MHNVYAIENFIKLKESAIVKEDINDIQHLKYIPIPSIANEVSLMIGQDVPDALKPLEVRDGGDGQPYAVRTPLIDNIFTNFFVENKSVDGLICADISDHFTIFHVHNVEPEFLFKKKSFETKPWITRGLPKSIKEKNSLYS